MLSQSSPLALLSGYAFINSTLKEHAGCLPRGSPSRPSDTYLEATDELELKLEIEEDESVRVAFCLSLLIQSVSILKEKKTT